MQLSTVGLVVGLVAIPNKGFPFQGTVLDYVSASVTIGAEAPSTPHAAVAVNARIAPTGPGPTESSEGASSTPDEKSELKQIVATVLHAITSRDWFLLASAVVMLLVFFVNKFWIRTLDSETRSVILPWSGVICACLLQFAASLVDTGSVLDALYSGFLTGAGAAGLWSLVGKHMLKRYTLPTRK